jgi:hypothetical protein
MKSVSVFFTTFFALSLTIQAQEEKILEDFFTGDAAYVQQKKELQLSLRSVYSRKIISFPLQVEYGISNRLQAEAEFRINSFSGENETAFGLRYWITRSQNAFHVSMGLEVGVSNLANGKNFEKEITWQPSLHIANKIGKAETHWSFSPEIAAGEFIPAYHAGFVLPVAKWRATLELNGSSGDEKEFALTPGLQWKGLEDFEFGMAYSRSLLENSGASAVMLMITHEFTFGKKNVRK